MDTETVERVTETLVTTAEEVGYTLSEVIIFGSRTRDDYRPESDVDVLLVSPDFEGMPSYKRPKLFYRHWDYDELPDPEFICLTPAEFEERKAKRPHIVRTAVEEGVVVA